MGILTVSTVCTALLFVLGLGARYLLPLLHNSFAAGILGRAKDEVMAAVHEVDATYTAAIKEANADGVLTDAEKKAAKDKAIAVAKANLGTKGLAALARIVGVEGVASWLSSWTERALTSKRIAETHADAAEAMAAVHGPLVQTPPAPAGSSAR